MGKHLSLKVKNKNEFYNLINQKDINISRSVVENVLANIKTKKHYVYVLEVEIEEENVILDITVSRSDFYNTLEKNLRIHEIHEMYEECVEIKKAMDYLFEKEFGK